MIGSTNSIWKVNYKAGEYEQLVNYTMLYDYGDECTDITGGWNTTFSTTSSYAYCTKNIDYLELYTKYSGTKKLKVSTNNTFDLSQYSKFGFKISSVSGLTTSTHAYCRQVGFSKNNTFKTNDSYPSSEEFIKTFYQTGLYTPDISTSGEYYGFLFQSVDMGGSTNTTNISSIFLVKSENWQSLAEKSGITASSIDDILTNSTTLLSNEEAVEYMIKQCTGDFMASAVRSNTFLAALNNSPYKTIIMANEHWAKFLNMVV